MIDPREDAQAYIEEHSINKLFQVIVGTVPCVMPPVSDTSKYHMYV